MQQGSSPDIVAQELGRAPGSHSFVHPLTDIGISPRTYGLENKATVGIGRTTQYHEEKNTQQDTFPIALKLLNSTHANKTVTVSLLTHLPLRLLHN